MKKSIFVAVFLLAAAVAGADTLNVTGPLGFTYSGVYVGPIGAVLNGVTPLQIICNDYVDTTYVPSSFSVNVSTIPSLTYAMYAQSGPPTSQQLLNYKMTAMLIWQMNQPGNQSAPVIGALNFAVWNLFNPVGVPDPAGSAGWVTWAQSQDPSAWDYNDFRVYTPLVGGNNGHGGVNQEFVSGAASQVPEPATGALAGLGAGLIGFGVIGRRWRQKKE